MESFPLMPKSFWDCCDFPPRILDQDFGLVFTEKDLLPPMLYRGFVIRPRTQHSMQKSGRSDVINAEDKFQILLNMNHFKAEDIDVKTVDDAVVVHGKHVDRSDGHGSISREFSRRYLLPEGVDPETVRSYLKPDGILIIEAPKKAVEPKPPSERLVPITMSTNSETIKSYLKPDGILVIEAPKKAIEPKPPSERVVPISLRMPVEGQD